MADAQPPPRARAVRGSAELRFCSRASGSAIEAASCCVSGRFRQVPRRPAAGCREPHCADGLSYQHYRRPLTFQLFLWMADERAQWPRAAIAVLAIYEGKGRKPEVESSGAPILPAARH